MKLLRVEYPEKGCCRILVSADAEEQRAALAEERRTRENAPAPAYLPKGQTEPVTEEEKAAAAEKEQEALACDAINRVLMEKFSPIYGAVVEKESLIPITDPEFSLLAREPDGSFCAAADFFVLEGLTLGRCTGFTQQVEPRAVRQVEIELDVNMHHGEEERRADAAGKQALRRQIIKQLYARKCERAWQEAKQELVFQLGAEVTGTLPKMLVHGNYFAEQRRFNLSLQANNLNFDLYLKAKGQTVEQFRAELHARAEQKLRSRLGLLLLAKKEGLEPDEAEVDEALAHWDERQGKKTFPENDRRRARQALASARAADFIAAHSTLLPPPETPQVEAPQKA